MKKSGIFIMLYMALMVLNFSCSEDLTEDEPVYTDDIWEPRVYKIERHPTTIRNGFGMDFLHEGDFLLDAAYLTEETINSFPYDILFYNDFAYTLNSTGDWSSTGNPVIFLHKDTKAAIAGYGKDIFDSFSPSDITALKSSLSSDPELDLESTKHKHDESCISDADGAYSHDEGFQVESLIHQEYAKLIIGNKFRPKTGGIFECKADDPDQINYQPVFLVQTREGGYAVFMVTLFKGTGLDTQKTTVTWRMISLK